MRFSAVSIGLIACICLASASSSSLDSHRDAFESFTIKYKKQYPSVAERNRRLAIYATNRQAATELSQSNPLATFGDSPFMDLSKEEFRRYTNAEDAYRARYQKKADGERHRFLPLFGQANALPPFHPHARNGSSSIPTTWNWRDYPVVTRVKNQGDCGSCWAFSTTGNIEGQWALNQGQLVSLSEQDLVSCCWMSFHCNGGDPDLTDLWLELLQKGRVATEESYPYVSGDGSVPPCQLNASTVWGATIDGYFDVTHNETQMGAVLYEHGPISIAVNATSFQSYTGGIMTHCDAGWFVDHAVLIVGYDDEHQPPYWIVKNSWGSDWGENGYIRLEKGTGQCHLDWFPQSAKVQPKKP